MHVFVFDLNVLLTVIRAWQLDCPVLRFGIILLSWQAFTIKGQANGLFGWVALGLTEQPDVLMQSYPKVEQRSKDAHAVFELHVDPRSLKRYRDIYKGDDEHLPLMGKSSWNKSENLFCILILSSVSIVSLLPLF